VFFIGEIMAENINEKNFPTASKIETCYLCNKEFDINANDNSHYHYNEYPMCNYCSEFYGFYKKER
jgi:hypothetical protein